MSTAENNITLNQGSGGPVVATDFVNPSSGISAHVQYVKLDIGADNAHQPVNTTTHLPISISSLPSNWLSLPVGGGTGGQGITITGTINAGIVGVSHGTLDRIAEGVSVDVRSFSGLNITLGNTQGGIGLIEKGVSIDIRSIPGSVTLDLGGGTVDDVLSVKSVVAATLSNIVAGITIGVATVSGETVSITTGSNFIKTGGLPVTNAMTTGVVTCDNAGASGHFPDFNAVKGIVIKNLSNSATAGISLGFTFGAPVLIGSTTGVSGADISELAKFRVLYAGDEMRLEAQDFDEVFFRSITAGNGATQSLLTFHVT